MFNRLQRVSYPNGTWDVNDLIGAKVRIMSMPVSNFSQLTNTGGEKTIEKVEFQVSIDGKAFTVITLKEVPGHVFTWKDLMITRVANSGGIIKGRALSSDCHLADDFLAGEGDKGSANSGGEEEKNKFKFGCP